MKPRATLHHTIDLLAAMARLACARLSDADDQWLLTDNGAHVCLVTDLAVETGIRRGWLEDVADDLMDEPIWRLSPLGLAHLQFTTNPRKRRTS